MQERHCSTMRLTEQLTAFQSLLLLVLLPVVWAGLSDVTTDVFGSHPIPGIVAAFGDYDADKATDVFVLSPDGKSVFVLEADIDIRRDGAKFNRRDGFLIHGSAEDPVITSVVPGDFNSDAQMDLLITRKKDMGTSEVTVEIYTQGQPDEPYLTIAETMQDQPALIDWNGDMLPDLLGETSDGHRAVWTFQANGSYTMENMTATEELPPLRVPQSSAFVDLDGDLTADLCVVTEKDNKVTFEFWMNREGTLTFTRRVSAPQELKVVGQASFVDLNGNHETNIVLPGCLDLECDKSAVFVFDYDKYSDVMGRWFKIPVNFERDSKQHTTFEKSAKVTPWLSLPMALRMGDFNRDGYPDAVAVLRETKNGETKACAYLLINSGCSGEGCEYGRSLDIDYSQPLHKHTPVLSGFFDLMENGALDVLLTEVREDGTLTIRAIEQHFNGDASFLKVLVTSGLCHNHCPDGNKPYGVNQVGPTVKFESTTDSGSDQIGVASQLTQAAYMSLQLPFVLFGLGRTPNFIDELEVGLPTEVGKTHRSHSWSTIIPNSWVIVIPYPLDSPSSWKHELYVMPSRLVLLTGASLLGTCGFIAIIVGLLHWRERREDKREKLQEAQRFHFDAM